MDAAPLPALAPPLPAPVRPPLPDPGPTEGGRGPWLLPGRAEGADPPVAPAPAAPAGAASAPARAGRAADPDPANPDGGRSDCPAACTTSVWFPDDPWELCDPGPYVRLLRPPRAPDPFPAESREASPDPRGPWDVVGRDPSPTAAAPSAPVPPVRPVELGGRTRADSDPGSPGERPAVVVRSMLGGWPTPPAAPPRADPGRADAAGCAHVPLLDDGRDTRDATAASPGPWGSPSASPPARPPLAPLPLPRPAPITPWDGPPPTLDCEVPADATKLFCRGRRASGGTARAPAADGRYAPVKCATVKEPGARCTG